VTVSRFTVLRAADFAGEPKVLSIGAPRTVKAIENGWLANKTRSVFDRYTIASEGDLRDAANKRRPRPRSQRRRESL
jgi:hypothetical protein